MISGLEAYIQAVYDLNQDDDDDDDDDRNREGFPLSQIIRGHFMHNWYYRISEMPFGLRWLDRTHSYWNFMSDK